MSYDSQINDFGQIVISSAWNNLVLDFKQEKIRYSKTDYVRPYFWYVSAVPWRWQLRILLQLHCRISCLLSWRNTCKYSNLTNIYFWNAVHSIYSKCIISNSDIIKIMETMYKCFNVSLSNNDGLKVIILWKHW